MTDIRTKKISRSIVGFDMDGVILNNSGLKLKMAKKLGFNLKLSQTHAETIKNLIPKVALSELKNAVYDNNEIGLTTPLMNGIRGILKELNFRKIPIFLISRRKTVDLPIKILKKNYLWPAYFNEKNTYFVKDPKDKNIIAAKLGITHYIDDEFKVISILSKVPNRFLFDQFGIFKEDDRYVKIKSWLEFKNNYLNKI